MTAIFKATGTDDLSLDKVAAIGDKLLTPQFAATARRAQIHEVVVADSQYEVTGNGTSAAQETKIANGEVTLIPVANLDSAYAHLGRWSKLTQFAREQLGKRAEQILQERCDPYIEPLCSREDKQVERGLDPLGRPLRTPLGKEEFTRIIRGELLRARNRLAVLGDSGMGKSMFLVYCEQMIAAGNGPYLPLRLGAGPIAGGDAQRMSPLSYFNWTGKPDEVLDNLADSLLQGVLPEDPGTDVRAWLRTLVRHGRVVFLLDALDQTTSTLPGLGKFLQSKEIAAGPVLSSAVTTPVPATACQSGP